MLYLSEIGKVFTTMLLLKINTKRLHVLVGTHVVSNATFKCLRVSLVELFAIVSSLLYLPPMSGISFSDHMTPYLKRNG